MRRGLLIGAMTMVFVGLISGTALAHECVNASKRNQSAGAQIVVGDGDDPVYITTGLQKRIENGVVDYETGEGFHGIIGFDGDGDGQADLSTWLGVGPEGEIPEVAQFAGPPCRGITNVEVYFENCLGG